MPLSLLNNNFYAPKNNKKYFLNLWFSSEIKIFFSFVLQKVLVLVSFHRFRDKKTFFLFSLIINFKFQINLVRERERERERKCVWVSLHEVTERERDSVCVKVGGRMSLHEVRERERERVFVCVGGCFCLKWERSREKKEKVAKTARNFFLIKPDRELSTKTPRLEKKASKPKILIKNFWDEFQKRFFQLSKLS